MQKRNWLSLCLALCLLLCACTDKNTPKLPESDVPDTTETTDPAHTELYLPPYTTQQVWQYFEEIVLHVEYTDGIGDPSLVQKWENPIYYRIYGSPTDEDLSVLTALFAQLNAIPGFPGIYAAQEGTTENLSIHFWDRDDFNENFLTFLNGEDAYGATQFWYYTATNEIHTAKIGYRTDIDQNTRSSILLEEVINMLGISDTVLRTDSIVYQHSNENTALSDMDWLILKLFYHPSMQCGMDSEACYAVVQELYH